jgi:hypothetical protein
VLLVALDGFDVLAISFASPGIAKEWGIDRASLGIVLSMEIIGMALGSFTLGNVAGPHRAPPDGARLPGCHDRGHVPRHLGPQCRADVGFPVHDRAGDRRHARRDQCSRGRMRQQSPSQPRRVPDGRGLSSRRRCGGHDRDAAPRGWQLAIRLHVRRDRTAVCIPLVLWLLPESVSYLIERRPSNALVRINSTLRRLGHRAVQALPPTEAAQARRGSLAELFSPRLARATVLLTVAYFAHIMTFYYMLKWIPKIVVDMGFEPSSAGGVLVWANVGGASGALLFSVLTQRVGLKRLVIVALLLTAAMIVLFGRSRPELAQLAMLAAGTASSATPGSSASTRCSRSPSLRGSVRAAPAS